MLPVTLSQFVKIADALIDQSKQKNPNCPCSWRVTGYAEVTRKWSSVRVGDKLGGALFEARHRPPSETLAQASAQAASI
jgi:hypothetical protein